jgi:DNA-directed RNA polymerase subunit RPC12/RpoP
MSSTPFQRFPCAGCGTVMVFDPATNGLRCPACGSTKAVEATGPVAEQNLEAALQAAAHAPIAHDALQVNCSSCGSIIEFQPPEVSGACPFCAAPIVAQPKAADAHLVPNAVLPFAIPRDRARGLVQNWLGGLWFAPSDLKKMAQQDSVTGMYLPFYTYDAHTVSHYRGQRGEYYYETQIVTRTNAQGEREQVSERVRRTRWYPASGRVDVRFDDILIRATNSVQPDKLEKLEPWDLKQLKPYEPAFLSGFKAQRYQVELRDGFAAARQIMDAGIRSEVAGDIGGDEQRIDDVVSQYFDLTFKHILLPVWIGAYRFQGRVFQIVINARTGEVQGERPYSAAKIIVTILFVLFVIFLLAKLLTSER